MLNSSVRWWQDSWLCQLAGSCPLLHSHCFIFSVFVYPLCLCFCNARWVISFAKKNGLNGILRNLNYCYEKYVVVYMYLVFWFCTLFKKQFIHIWWCIMALIQNWITCLWKEMKWNLYSAYHSNLTTKRSDVDHTVTCKNTTSAFPWYMHSLEGDTAANSFTHLPTDILLIPRFTEGRRLSWPGWLTHSGRLTHEVVTRQP